MADFVAVLKKTIEGLGESTPAMRERVYEKARSTVAAKLAAISPPPPAAVAERQRRSLEDAILQVEREFAAEVGEPADPLESLQNIFPSLGGNGSRPGYTAAPPPRRSWESAAPVPAGVLPERATVQAPPPAAATDAPVHIESSGPVLAGDTIAPEAEDDQAPLAEAPRRRGSGMLIAAAIALVVVAGGGYGIWLNRDAFSSMLGMGGGETVAVAPTETAPAAPPAGETVVPQPAAVEPPANEAPGKFTQRLNADGTEVDEGPAGGEPAVGEGTSVAAATTPPAIAETPAAPPVETAPAGDGTTAAGEATPAVPPATGTATLPAAVAVAQKAIYYEERTNVAQGSADTGSLVWTVVQESPGGDQPPEPAIRANATIPAKNLQLTMTIRRNVDKTLPFSHMIELIFLTPDNFEGGGIENILRFALKDTEEAAGNSIIGTPAKIAEGFFLVALNDTPAEVEANLGMLRNQSWIDVPLVYKSGRRALITMEKGVPGAQVFDEVLKAWTASNAG